LENGSVCYNLTLLDAGAAFFCITVLTSTGRVRSAIKLFYALSTLWER